MYRFAVRLKAVLAALLLSASFVLFPSSSAGAEPIPVSDFFRHPAMSEAVMSPSGRYIAALVTHDVDRRRKLVVIDVQDLSHPKVIAGFNDADIANARWANDERLVFTIGDLQSPLGDQRFSGLYSVDREGRQAPRRLIKSWAAFENTPVRVGDRELSPLHTLFSTLRDGTNDVVVRKTIVDGRDQPAGIALFRLDTATGLARAITEGAPGNVDWFALDKQGIPRVAVAQKNNKSSLFWKPTANATGWTLLKEFDTYGSMGLQTLPSELGADDIIYGEGYAEAGGDTTSLLRMQVQSSEIKVKPLLSTAGFDYHGKLIFNPRGELLGVHYLSDAWSTFWFDARLKAAQQKLDALLPGTSNTIDCGDCADPGQVLVKSQSDRQPMVYRLYDTRTGALELLAQSRPWIDAAAMALRDETQFAARDGMRIPVHVTRPRGVKGAAPAVVLVHGGPWVRGGYWHWDADSQFLASRGYVVIEPEFRGSHGFGSKLFRAGFKQWGLKMQDDLVDAAKWAVKQGYADDMRICIAGASYGGYATLMGLIRDPDVFRCGVDWAGVSDIELMYAIHWSDASESWKTYGMPVMIGDREKDAAQLSATSPLKQAARLSRPLLIAHGSGDRRVPLEHATCLRDAVKSDALEFVVYPGEGHGWLLESTNNDFWGRVERFLAKHLATKP